MRPAFSSTKSAAAFAILLLLLLLSPVLAGKRILPLREEIYTSTPIDLGPFNSLHKEIFKDRGDIDIAFMGSSRMLHGIDPAYVGQKLSEKLGRPATVVTVGWSWAGADALYFITSDLLKNRKVKMLVFTEEFREGDRPHHAAPHFFRWAEDADTLGGLSRSAQAAYYFAAILGMPRNVLSLVRTNYQDLEPYTAGTWERRFHTLNPEENSGAIAARLGFNAPFDRPNFSDYAPANGVTPADVQIYTPDNQPAFEFSTNSCPPLQLHFMREFGKLAAQNHVALVCLHLPETGERQSPVVREKVFWPDAVNPEVRMIGVPPAKLFAGLRDEDIFKLYLDPYHFNKNGVLFMTPLITPALIQIYENQTNR